MEKKKMDYFLNIQLFAEDDDPNEKENEEEKVELDDSDFEEDSKDDDLKEETKKKPQQDKATNAQQAEARRKREREEKERKEREEKIKEESYLKGKLDSTKTNEFTDEPIEDEYDLKILELQRKIKAQGGDPIADLPKYLAKQERELNQSKKAENDKVSKDIESYRKAHPTATNEDIAKIINHPLGSKFLGKLTLEEVSELINETSSVAKEKEVKKAPKMPSSTTGKQAETSYSQKNEKERIEELRKAGLIR